MTDRSKVEFDHWIVCPKCLCAMVGEAGEICFICGVPCVSTPLYPPCEALGTEYTPEELALLEEFGV
jgi:hypothetical protein